MLGQILIYRTLVLFRYVSGNYATSETYIDIVTKGKKTQALLDHGCDRSVCPRRMCRNAKLIPVETELYLANGARL